jgi:spore cortex biosynthesis protein YabQ
MPRQIKLFLISLLVGVYAGILYDLIRVLRKLIKHNLFFIQLEDFFYWIIISSGVFFVMLSKNSGEVRSFCIAGSLIGMNIYAILFSKLIETIVFNTIKFIIRFIINILKIILYPIRLIIKILSIPFNFLKKYFGYTHNFLKNKSNKIKRYSKIKIKQKINNIKIFFKKI